ncbi:9349_t:CDS:1, partial [Racocetra fulgida]
PEKCFPIKTIKTNNPKVVDDSGVYLEPTRIFKRNHLINIKKGSFVFLLIDLGGEEFT